MPAALRLASIAILVALAQLPLATTRDRAAAARPRPPNVLIIVTDDQRAAGTLDVMPATRQWFARRGTAFAQAYATTPLCCPSRATIMTGRYAHNHGVHRNDDSPDGARALDHSTTIQRYLDDAGYRTGIFGKVLNHWNLENAPPHFDEWGILHGGYDDEKFNVNGRLRRLRGYTTNVLARMSARFLRRAERRDGKPWLLYVTPFAPHLPATPERRYADVRVPPWNGRTVVNERNVSDKPAYLDQGSVGFGLAREFRRLQLRTLLSVDDLVARLVRTMDGLGEERDTLAFFLSDNGFAWGDRGWVGKSTPYTESIRIPFLVRWPAGSVATGPSSRRITGTVDIAPTVLDAAGLMGRVERPLDGRSLLRPWRRPWILTEFWGSTSPVRPWASIRSRRYHYIEHYDLTTLRPTFFEYYALGPDPGERRNLLADGETTNDPSRSRLVDLSLRLGIARRCAGRGSVVGCP